MTDGITALALWLLGIGVMCFIFCLCGIHIGRDEGRLEVCEAYAINDAVPVRFDGSTCIYETLQ